MEHVSNLFDKMCKQKIKPIDTGIPFLDNIIGGYFPGEMTTVCGNEGECKLAFIAQQVCHVAIDRKVPTLLLLNYESERIFLSLMMTYYYSIKRCGHYDIFGEKEYQNVIAEFKELLKETPLYVVKTGFFEEEISILEEIDRFIVEKDIKMMILTEVILDLTRDDIQEFSSIRRISIKRNIPLLVSASVWNDRMGIEHIRPTLQDIARTCYVHGHDVVIGFTDYYEYDYLPDNPVDVEPCKAGPNGILYEKVALEVLKPEEFAVSNLCYFPRDFFFLRNYSQNEIQKLKTYKKNGAKDVQELIRKLDLVLDDEWKNPS